MKNSSSLVFLTMLLLGTMITISSNSWLSCWMGLEINLLSFIPMMIKMNNMMSTEATLKYFLTQVFASSLMLFSIIIYLIMFNFMFQFNFMNKVNISFMIFITLLIKSGTAPFHFWFPIVMEGLSWMNNFILMTWQKIAPLMLMSYFFMNNFFYLFIIFSVIIGSIGGLNQTSLRKIMAFSSINHIGWMMSAMIFNEYMLFMYFLIYMLLSFSLILIFNIFNSFYLNQMYSLFMNSILLKFVFMISLLSLGGLPPFLGFLPKWLIIQSLININNMFIIMILISTSLITLYFYLRICYSAFLINLNQMMWLSVMNFNKLKFMSIALFIMISLISLLMFINLTYFII